MLRGLKKSEKTSQYFKTINEFLNKKVHLRGFFPEQVNPTWINN